MSSRCLTSVIVWELVFPSWHQLLTVIEHLNISFVLEEMSNVLGVIRQNDNVLRRHLFCLFLLFSCFVCYLSWMMFLSAIFRISFLSHFSSSFLADSERARVFSLLPRDDIKKIRRSKRCVCKKWRARPNFRASTFVDGRLWTPWSSLIGGFLGSKIVELSVVGRRSCITCEILRSRRRANDKSRSVSKARLSIFVIFGF